MALTDKLTAIGDAIREKTGKEDLIPLDDMPSEIRSIETGSGDSYYDTFWNTYQENGMRIYYDNAFRGYRGTKAENYKNHYCWDAKTFAPKYSIKPTQANSMFYAFPSAENGGIDDFEAFLNERGIALDFSECTSSGYCFSYAEFTVLPILDLTKITYCAGMLEYCSNLHTIRKIVLPTTGDIGTTFFGGCSKLANIIFDGEFKKTVSFANSTLLSAESVQSIIDALADLTGETAQTLRLHADVKTKLTDTQIAIITNKNWTLA